MLSRIPAPAAAVVVRDQLPAQLAIGYKSPPCPPRRNNCPSSLAAPAYRRRPASRRWSSAGWSTCNRAVRAGKSVVICNDGSDDNTGEVLAGLAARFPALKVVTHQKNQGAAAALTTAIAATTKAWVLLIDSDGQFPSRTWSASRPSGPSRRRRRSSASAWARRTRTSRASAPGRAAKMADIFHGSSYKDFNSAFKLAARRPLALVEPGGEGAPTTHRDHLQAARARRAADRGAGGARAPRHAAPAASRCCAGQSTAPSSSRTSPFGKSSSAWACCGARGVRVREQEIRVSVFSGGQRAGDHHPRAGDGPAHPAVGAGQRVRRRPLHRRPARAHPRHARAFGLQEELLLPAGPLLGRAGGVEKLIEYRLPKDFTLAQFKELPALARGLPCRSEFPVRCA